MKKTMMMVAVAMLGGAATLPARGDTEVVDGITWTYTVSGGTASVGGSRNTAVPNSTTGAITIPSTLGGKPVTSIGSSAFDRCSGLTSVTIPSGVTSIGKSAFYGCNGLTSVTIPSGVTSIGYCAFCFCSGLESVTIPSSVTIIGERAFDYCSGLTSVMLLGVPPTGIAESKLLSNANLFCQRQYGGAWIQAAGGVAKFGGCISSVPSATVISSSIRANDPTILDVVYKVTSTKPTVKVRVLAFEDGVRSFAKVVRPEAFVTDTNGVETACNVGDGITPNVEHTISWRVSSDWKTKLAKLKFEVLASEGELLPLELMTIPASDQYGKMKISWNAITASQWFDALLWLYADKTEGLTSTGGILKNGTTQLASGTGISAMNAATYVYGKMGYSVLTGAPLTYANAETRLGLSPSGARQYAYKIVEE